jgi:hypothetical protein
MGQSSGVCCIFGLGWSEMTKLLSPSFSCSVYRLGRDPLAYTVYTQWGIFYSKFFSRGKWGPGLQGGGGIIPPYVASSCIKLENSLCLLELLNVKGRKSIFI